MDFLRFHLLLKDFNGFSFAFSMTKSLVGQILRWFGGRLGRLQVCICFLCYNKWLQGFCRRLQVLCSSLSGLTLAFSPGYQHVQKSFLLTRSWGYALDALFLVDMLWLLWVSAHLGLRRICGCPHCLGRGRAALPGPRIETHIVASGR